MFESSKYKIDKLDCIGFISRGAILYRITSPWNCSKDDIISGIGPSLSKNQGRFNGAQQRASYCANNMMICISEILYHQVREVINNILKTGTGAIIRSLSKVEKKLCIFDVDEITGLLNLEAEDFRRDFNPMISGTSTVIPDSTYKPFIELVQEIRAEYRGLFYPSARHSKDYCVVFFGDESDNILSTFSTLDISLRLIKEDQDYRKYPDDVNPLKDKISFSRGYYEFNNHTEFQRLKTLGLFNPNDIEQSGYIDFVRKKYINYPKDAIKTCVMDT